jgi:hypothetical protein
MFKASVLEVFISSPSDIQVEKKMVYDVIDEWNIINSKNRNAVIKAVDWGNNIYSTMSDERAQESINKQILEDSDLLIGIFWTRLGTPTGNYISGSVEEIEKHLSLKKPILLFFSNAPVLLESVDQEQYQKLKDFKKRCQDRGIINSYNSTDDFIKKFRFQLGLLMNKDEKVLELIGNLQGNNDQNIKIDSMIKLSEDAKHLLKEISQDHNGLLFAIMTLAGYNVQTNGKNISAERYDSRNIAKIKGVIEELESHDLIKANNSKRDTFLITAKGFDIADQINM